MRGPFLPLGEWFKILPSTVSGCPVSPVHILHHLSFLCTWGNGGVYHLLLPNKYNKKQATNQGAMKIDDDDICEIIEEVYRRDKFDEKFNIGLISECEDDESISEDEEESSGDDTH